MRNAVGQVSRPVGSNAIIVKAVRNINKRITATGHTEKKQSAWVPGWFAIVLVSEA